MKVYISGPMTGQPLLGFPAFDAARDELAARGFVPVSPADLDRAAGFDPAKLPANHDWTDIDSIGFSLSDAMDRDIAALRKCDAIYMLRGWQNSKGAKAELALAQWMGLEVMEQPETILEEAARLCGGSRQDDYGGPVGDFTRTAKMWSAMKGVDFEPREVALFMAAVKISRECHRSKRDNWVDLAGYAHCGYQCAELAQE